MAIAPDKKLIRLHNTRLLMAQLSLGNTESQKGVKLLADRLGKIPQQVSAFAGDNPVRGIGNKVAGEIEQAFNLPEGWLSVEHSQAELEAMGIDTNTASESNSSAAQPYYYASESKPLQGRITAQALAAKILQAQAYGTLSPEAIASLNSLLDHYIEQEK